MSRKSTSLENEIERARWEERWNDVPKLAEQLSPRTTTETHIDGLKKLLLGEAQLEKYLMDKPFGTAEANRTRKDLANGLDLLNKVVVTDDKAGKEEQTQEALLLLCKAHFVCQDYHACIKCCNQAGETDIYVDHSSKRKSKLIAEAFAYKAMALEQLLATGESDVSEDDIISCYENASDIAIWLTSDLNPGQRSPNSAAKAPELGVAIEVAVQRSPILLIKNGKLTQGINRYRNLLKIVESKSTHNLRKVLARQLAEVLLRGVCERTYEKPAYLNSNVSGSISSLRGLPKPESKALVDTASPRRTNFSLRPPLYSGESLFVPRDEMEEALLLLLLEEAMVLKDAVLSQAPERSNARKQSIAQAETVYNLLTVALTRQAQYGMLAECLDRGMKLAFDEFHLWFQFGLSLISAGKYRRALLVLKHCAQVDEENVLVPLYAAKLCFNNLHKAEEGIEFSKKALACQNNPEMKPRSYQALGIGYSLQASEVCLTTERQKLQKQAIEALQKAHELDPDDSEILFHLSLSQAIMRKIPRALTNIRSVVKMDANNLYYLHLLALLLSAQKKYAEALDVCDAALLEYPEDFSLLMAKVKLEEACISGDQALITCKHMLETWKQVYESDISGSIELRRAGSGLLDRVVADTRSLKQIPLTEINSEVDSVDGGSSIAASVRLEQALSDEAVSASVSRLSIPAAFALQAKLWLAIADVYTSMGKYSESNACVQEAKLIFPLSPDVLFQRGRISEISSNYNEAKGYFESATAINPTHIPSLQHLGMVHHKLGDVVMAEKVLREAINIDPTDHLSWHNLGVVLQSKGDHEAAADCLMAAVNLETTCPIVPFTLIPRIL